MVSLPTGTPAPPQPQARPNSVSNRKPGVLTANLEEMKVCEDLFVAESLLGVRYSFLLLLHCPDKIKVTTWIYAHGQIVGTPRLD